MKRATSVQLAVSGLIAATCHPAPVLAQDAAMLDEIIVTARRVEENLQEVPISINVISAEQIARQNIQTTADVARLDPSVIFDYGGSMTDMRVVIRGLSPTRGRVNSAILVDGIDVTSESLQFAGGSLLSSTRLFDLERVEIVKGPQSALYGRSAFAGAISYITKDPAEELGGELQADVAEYGRYNAGFALTGPVTETFGARLSGTWWEDDGVYRSGATGQKVGGGDGAGAALAMRWAPSDSFAARARIEYSEDHYAPRATVYLRHNTTQDPPAQYTCANAAAQATNPDCVFTGTLSTGGTPGSLTRAFYWGSAGRVGDLDAPLATSSPNPATGRDYPGADRESTRASLTLAWDVGPGAITSWTGYTDAQHDYFQDLDQDSIMVGGIDVALRTSEFDARTKTTQFSQEIRFQSDLDGPFNFALGGQYYKAEDDQLARSINILCFPAFFNCSPAPGAAQQIMADTPAIDRPWGRDLEHKSVYGLVEFRPFEQWTFSAEARYAEETEEVYGPNCALPAYTFNFGPGASVTQPCQDPTLTSEGSPFPPGTPGVVFPFAVFGPSTIQLYSPFLPSGPIQAPSVTARTGQSESFTTWRTFLRYQPTTDLNFYATVSRGVKPGGISTVTAGSWLDSDFDGSYEEITYAPEKLTLYELGAKMQWLDDRLRTNFALFRQVYEDKQTGVQTLTPNGTPVGRIINAGEARIDGLEADIALQVTESFSVALSYSYLDAKYTDFVFPSTSATDVIRNGGNCTVQEFSGRRQCLIDALASGGLQLEDVPEHALVAQARYEGALAGELRWFIEGDAEIQSKRYVDPSNHRWVNGYDIYNVRLGLARDNWEIMAYVENLTDDDTIRSAQDSPGDVDAGLFAPNSFSPTDGLLVTLADPRRFGLRVNWWFGGR